MPLFFLHNYTDFIAVCRKNEILCRKNQFSCRKSLITCRKTVCLCRKNGLRDKVHKKQEYMEGVLRRV